MAKHQQIEIFDLLCAAILLRLYEQFPSKSYLSFMELRVEEKLEPLEPIEIEKWLELFVDTVTWLEQEGFIRSDGGTDDQDFRGARLTMHGLTVLRAVPASVQPASVPLADRLRTAIGSGSKLASKEGLRLAVGSVFAAAKSVIGA